MIGANRSPGCRQTRSTDWDRAPLTPEDLAQIDAATWTVFTRDEVVAVAEGWQAGLDSNDMAPVLQVRPGSIRILIGNLKQRGVALRSSSDVARRTASTAARRARGEYPLVNPQAVAEAAFFDALRRRFPNGAKLALSGRAPA